MPEADTTKPTKKKNYYENIPQATPGFFLKGAGSLDWGMKNRLSRIFNPATGRTVMLAIDHGYFQGPTTGLERIDLNIVPLMPMADALMLTRGILRTTVPPSLTKPIVLRCSGGPSILKELSDEELAVDIEDAIRLNVSAVTLQVFIGGEFETRSVHNMTRLVDMGLRAGIPTLAVTAVGKTMTRDAQYLRLACRICAELGAQFVKTYYVPEEFETVTASCPVPIVMAGGKKLPELEALTMAYNAIQQGASGVDMGRNIFQSDAPKAMMQAVAKVVHENLKPKDAFDLFETLKNQEIKNRSAMAKTSQLDAIARVAPVLRGLLAEPTGDDDHPLQPADFEKSLPAVKICAARFHLIRFKTGESDEELRSRLAASLQNYKTKHKAGPEFISLPDVGAFQVLKPKAEPGHDRRLVGRTALVTGAAGAIGYGICQGLLERGCHVAITDLPGERFEKFVAEFQKRDAERVIGVPMDVTDAKSVASAFAKISATWGGVDIVVMNAGLALACPLVEIDLEAFRRLERVNVEGTLLVLAEAGRHFARQNTGGDVILISTKNVFAPGAGFGAYSATKAAAHQLARIASLEFAPLSVRVNMVAPDAVFSGGAHKSGLWAEVGPGRMKARGLDEKGLEEYYRNRNLLKARVTAEHVANAVLFFATRQTPTTGACIPVDGGLPDATPR